MNSTSQQSLDTVYENFLDAYGVEGRTAQRFIPGAGNLNADVMIIGEAPGEHEDRYGIPFCGPAGTILDRLITEYLSLTTEDVFKTNVYKFRFPNKDHVPTEYEFKAAHSLLSEEIKVVRPNIIILCGKAASNAIYPGQHFSPLIGKTAKIKRTKFIFTVHPVVMIYNPSLEASIVSHFQTVRNMMDNPSYKTDLTLG